MHMTNYTQYSTTFVHTNTISRSLAKLLVRRRCEKIIHISQQRPRLSANTTEQTTAIKRAV